MTTTYASIRSQFTGITAVAASGGSLTGSGTVYIFGQGRNRSGRNILSTPIAVTYTTGQKINVTFPVSLRGDADELIEVVVSVNSTNDPTTAKRVASWRLKNVLTQDGTNYPGQGTNRSLPYTIELTRDAHLIAGATVANNAGLPTGTDRIHGMIRYVTATAKYLRYDSEAISGEVASSPGFWVLSSQADLETYQELTSGVNGCDRPLVSLSLNSVLSPPPYLADGTDSFAVRYWINNGLEEAGGSVLPAGSRLGFQFLVDGVNQSYLFSGRAIARLLGYVRRSTGVLDTSMSGVGSDIVLDGSSSSIASPALNGVELPADLQRGYAAVYEVVLRFRLDELTQSSSDGYRLTEASKFSLLIYPIGELGIPEPGDDQIRTDGDKLRILPDTIGIKRRSGSGRIGNYRVNTRKEQTAIVGLIANTANQKVCANGALNSESLVRQNTDPLLSNERLRAIVSTAGGTFTASAYTSVVSISAANQVINFTINYPSAIRANYPDVIKSTTAPFNVPKVLIYVKDDLGVIYQVQEVTPSGTSQIIAITSLGSTTVGSLPTNADTSFCLFGYGALSAAPGSGLSSIPVGTYEVAIAYHFPAPNNAVTAISHDPALGCLKELDSLSVNAFTSLTASFTQPAIASSVAATVAASSWMSVGQTVFIEAGGYYEVSAIVSTTEITLINLGYEGSATPGATVPSTAKVSPGGVKGAQGLSNFALTTASFTMPSVDSNVTVTVDDGRWMTPGLNVFVESAGHFTVFSVASPTSITLTNLGYTGNATPTSTIATAKKITASGIRGATGSVSNADELVLNEVAVAPSAVANTHRFFNLNNALQWREEGGAIATVAAIDKTQTFTKPQAFATTTLTDGSTITIDLALGNKYEVTVNGNRTLTISNPIAGQSIELDIVATGGDRTITAGTDLVLPDLQSGAFTVPNGKMITLSGKVRGTKLYAEITRAFTP